ncbi:MAG TPA: FHA domain-containing protein [Prosthecobacter sp.]
MASVVFYMEDGSTLVHKLENEVTTIGRHPDSLVQLTCPSSSGRHATIKQTGDEFYVQDLGSSNGTRVNGAEIEEALLKDGDRVGFGDVQAVFYAGDPPASAKERPVGPGGGKNLPPPAIIIYDEPTTPAVPARVKSGRALSPVRRAYGSKSSGYPDTAESGCATAFVVICLFLFAFVVGLALRHSKDMNGNLLTDTLEKVFGNMPKIKIEKKEE